MKILLFLGLCLGILAMARAATLQVSVTDSKGAPLPNTVVFAVPRQPVSTTGLEQVEVEQKNKEFLPFVSVVPTGTTAYFPNHDGIGHHVYSFSAAKSFELPLSEQELTVPILFDMPGIITVGCNIHDWMVAYINVVDTPYYALTDDDGKAVIEAMPTNEYTLHIWHPGMDTDDDMEKVINLGPVGIMDQAFSIGIRPEYFWKPLRPPENEEEIY
jgi:plastocyanin